MNPYIKTPRQQLLARTGILPVSSGALNTPREILAQKSGVLPRFADGGATPSRMNAEMILNDKLPPRYDKGGKVVQWLASKLKPATQDVLPLAQREANKAKFLADSAEKRVMYHGNRGAPPLSMRTGDISYNQAVDKFTNEGIKAFNPKESLNFRPMTFVTPDPKFAEDFANAGAAHAPAIYPLHVQVKNPFDFENPAQLEALTNKIMEQGVYRPLDPNMINKYIGRGSWDIIEDPAVIQAARDLGHDAMYMKEAGVKNLGIFDPGRIKSAVGNRGTYDIRDPDINKADGGVVHMAEGSSVPPKGLGSRILSGLGQWIQPAFAAEPMHRTIKSSLDGNLGRALEGASEVAQVMAPLKAGLLGSLVTYSGGLNENEDEELARYRAMTPEYLKNVKK